MIAKISRAINVSILEEEIAKERQKGAESIAKLRIFFVCFFFLLHIIIGNVFDDRNFRNKEILLAGYLGLSILALLSAKYQTRYNFLRDYSIVLIDIPFTLLVLRSWAAGYTDEGKLAAVSIFGLALMLFFVQASGLLFNRRINLITFIISFSGLYYLWLKTGLWIDSRLNGALLLSLSGYSAYLISTRFKNLVTSVARRQLINEKFSRYFTPEVASLIQSEKWQLENSQGKFDITVLFVDIRDFMRTASNMSAESIINMLNEVHEHLVACIFSKGGTLDKYLGDGLMAYFGAPVVDPDHAEKAVKCALLMRKKMKALNEKRITRGDLPLQIGIGIHSGPAIVGDIGAEMRREFTAIGETVNIASRIESLTKKHHVDILISSATHNLISKKHEIESKGFDEIRGTQIKIETFTIPEGMEL